jgi:hypothetical protein
MTEIKSGQGVAVFALPMPLNGVALINDTIQRIYGTGEFMLKFEGESIQVNAPKDGFGPRKKSRGKPAPIPDDDGFLVNQTVVGDELKLTLEMSEETVHSLAEPVRMYLDEFQAVNYVEMRLQDKATEAEFIYIVQRAAGKSPHDLRREAEERVAQLEEQLAAAREQVNGMADSLDDSIDLEAVHRVLLHDLLPLLAISAEGTTIE